MTREEADRMIEAIRKTTARIVAEGPDACRKFLIDAGIIKPKNQLMTYVASESFRSSGGEKFSFGQEIGDFEYNRLTRDEKMKFRRKYSSDDSYVRSSTEDNLTTFTLGGAVQNDTPPETNHETHSFGGYGDGDSGGAGSGGSWDTGSDYGSSDGGSGDGGGGGSD